MTPCPSCGAPFTPSLPDQTVCDACAGLHQPEESSPLQQTRVGGYTLVHELGAGRFSTSWLAEQQDGGGVVLKLLRAYAPDEGTVQRFLEEAKRLAQGGPHDHSGVARVLEAGVQIGGALFLVYESGGELTMADELRGRGRMHPVRAIALCAQLCDGLAALHGAGLLHHGLKPANVGLAKEEDGTESAVILDAFTAHLLSRAGLRETGLLPISTAAFLSPEEAHGHEAGPAADLYAVGVLLFQLISGRLPVMGSTSEELIEAHKTQRVLRLRDVGRKVHPDLESVLARLLAKDPLARFPDAASAAKALRAAQTEPVEGAAAVEDEEFEDPVPILSSQGTEGVGTVEEEPGGEPEVAAPKAATLDPDLEQALLGNVPHAEESAAPQRAAAPAPGRASALPPWLTPLRAGAAAAILCAVAFSAIFALGGESRRARKRASAAAAAAAERPKPPPPAPASAPPPEPTPVAAADPAPAPQAPVKKAAKPAPAKKVALTPPPPPSRFVEPQRLLGKGDAAGAVQALDKLLAGSLTAPERAQGTRLMAEAQAKAGNKQGAVSWYRKYLQLAGDAEERARVVKKIAELNR
jgi:serine/threonine-protein kinase